MAELPGPFPEGPGLVQLPYGDRPVLAASAASGGMVLFALLAHSPLPGFALAMAGLILTVGALSVSFRTGESVGSLFGLARLTRPVLGWTVVGSLAGAGLALLFRHISDQTLLPGTLASFVFVASAIGAAEELLYRGFVQGRLARLGWPAAVALAALAHTAYKTALFAFPPEGLVIQLPFLAFWTLLAGVAFGLIRHFCGSVVPALMAHVLFDILVYGDWVRAPWWVWG